MFVLQIARVVTVKVTHADLTHPSLIYTAKWLQHVQSPHFASIQSPRYPIQTSNIDLFTGNINHLAYFFSIVYIWDYMNSLCQTPNPYCYPVYIWPRSWWRIYFVQTIHASISKTSRKHNVPLAIGGVRNCVNCSSRLHIVTDLPIPSRSLTKFFNAFSYCDKRLLWPAPSNVIITFSMLLS